VSLDQIDCAVLNQLLSRPRAAVRDYARTLGLARGTVQARLNHLERDGIIRGFAPTLDHVALGFPVLAFVHVNLHQGQLGAVIRDLGQLPQVVEAYSTTGDADIFCRLVARDHADLEVMIQAILEISGVVRTWSEIALSERIRRRDLSLLSMIARRAPASPRGSPAGGDGSLLAFDAASS